MPQYWGGGGDTRRFLLLELYNFKNTVPVNRIEYFLQVKIYNTGHVSMIHIVQQTDTATLEQSMRCGSTDGSQVDTGLTPKGPTCKF